MHRVSWLLIIRSGYGDPIPRTSCPNSKWRGIATDVIRGINEIILLLKRTVCCAFIHTRDVEFESKIKKQNFFNSPEKGLPRKIIWHVILTFIPFDQNFLSRYDISSICTCPEAQCVYIPETFIHLIKRFLLLLASRARFTAVLKHRAKLNSTGRGPGL